MASLTFTVTRSGDTTVPLIINYTTQGTGANPVNAADHLGGAFPAGRITIAAGATTGSIVISSNPDTDYEPDETGLLTITSPTAGVTISPSTAVYTFLNDDAAPSTGGGDVIVYGPTTTGDTGYVQVGSAKQRISGKISDKVFFFSLGSNADGSNRLEVYHGGYAFLQIKSYAGGVATDVNTNMSWSDNQSIPAGSDFAIVHDPVAATITVTVNGVIRTDKFPYAAQNNGVVAKTGTYARLNYDGATPITITRLL